MPVGKHRSPAENWEEPLLAVHAELAAMLMQGVQADPAPTPNLDSTPELLLFVQGVFLEQTIDQRAFFGELLGRHAKHRMF